jgi:NTE family protein
MSEINQEKTYPIGISLSGGGARGIAHLGVLHALEEIGIRPDIIAGVSAGAIVGALYSHGYSPKEILRMVRKVKFFSFLSISALSQPGFLSLQSIEDMLKEYLPHNSFDGLKIPLTISATDVNEGETVYFSSGELIKPIIASACVPLVFSPVVFQGKTLVDGGIISSMEVKPLRKCQKILGIHTNPFDRNQPVSSARLVLERCLSLSIHANARANFEFCDFVIEPSLLQKIAAHRIDKAGEIFQIGYRSAMSHKEELIKIFT